MDLIETFSLCNYWFKNVLSAINGMGDIISSSVILLDFMIIRDVYVNMV